MDISSFMEESYDSLYLKEPHLEILLEGVILNKKDLLTSYALSDFKTLLLELYSVQKENIIKNFEGEFRGVIFDKLQDRVFVFTNPTSTQRVFYTKQKNSIFIDSNLIRLNENLKSEGIKLSPNIQAFYQLLSMGGMLENETVLDGVFKVYEGHYLDIDCSENSVIEKEYFSSFNEDYFSGTKEKAYSKIHAIFSEAIRLEYTKDEQLGKNHLALLSGGLDSRVAMMYALKQDKKPDSVFCFSQSGYFDETISRKIADDYDLHYEFVPLDGGLFLKKIDQLTEISEGLVLYTGGIHAQHGIDKMQYENFSLFHSGQLGDAILGGYLSAPTPTLPSKYKAIDNELFFPKIENEFSKAAKKYKTEESFLLRNRGYNRILLGAHVFQQKAYQTSPFMSKEFLKFAISLPEDWKFKHHFYLEWISKYCPESTNYLWERTLMKPNAKWKTHFGDRFLKPFFVKLHEVVLNRPDQASMYPYEYYFSQSEEIQLYYASYFKENIGRLDAYSELQKDVEMLFSNSAFYSKAQAINVLSIFKMYF